MANYLAVDCMCRRIRDRGSSSLLEAVSTLCGFEFNELSIVSIFICCQEKVKDLFFHYILSNKNPFCCTSSRGNSSTNLLWNTLFLRKTSTTWSWPTLKLFPFEISPYATMVQSWRPDRHHDDHKAQPDHGRKVLLCGPVFLWHDDATCSSSRSFCVDIRWLRFHWACVSYSLIRYGQSVALNHDGPEVIRDSLLSRSLLVVGCPTFPSVCISRTWTWAENRKGFQFTESWSYLRWHLNDISNPNAQNRSFWLRKGTLVHHELETPVADSRIENEILYILHFFNALSSRKNQFARKFRSP